MRILSIVTLVSPTGEYGGPVRVAVNQARALAELGHEVTIAGGHRGFETPPAELEGVPARLFPARTILPGAGFAGLAAPGIGRWVRHAARSADVVHIHLARDLVTLPAARAARRAGIPYVLQTHGMIDPSTNPLAKPLDAAGTRPVLHDAAAVLYLTPVERAGLEAVAAAPIALTELRNGVPSAEPAAAGGLEVLYLARLAPRKRPEAFVDAASRLAGEFPDATFRLVGPDEGRADEVARRIEDSPADLAWEGALDPERTGERMSRAAIYVLPAVDEPYPMSVLEAMSAGLPVVVTDTCGLAPVVAETGCGIVVDDSLDALTSAMRRLLADPELRREQGRRARQAAQERFSMRAIAEDLQTIYRRAVDGQGEAATRGADPLPSH